MILQSLVSCYEGLAEKGILAKPGWSPVKVSYALDINDEGTIINVTSMKVPAQRGKKTILIPQEVTLPTPVKRSSGVSPNFICDNSSYILGIDQKGKPERSKSCFEACRELHETLLKDVDDPAAKAVLKFFESWKPEMLNDLDCDEETRTELTGGGNLVFMYASEYVHENPAIREAWQDHYSSSDGECYPCLVTGKLAPVATLHPSIKGIQGAQSSGASLVSFNADAFCSYNREQGLNAPTSEYAAFAYGAALNYLISTQNTRIGDTTVLFWAEKGDDVYREAMSWFGWGNTPKNYSEEDLKGLIKSITKGKSVTFDGELLDPSMRFYILGLAPNAARLSVRFFLQNSFGGFVKNIQEHYARLDIVRPAYDTFETIPLWKLLGETVNQNSRDKTPVPGMAGETLKAILTNTRYPATLLNGVELRIRADREINRNRAALIKAFYLKNKNKDVPEEVLTVSLNQESTNVAYTLGRLFSVLEDIQNSANPGINATIRDKYFSSASSTPSAVFPTLVNLAQKHLKKLDDGKRIYFEKQLNSLFDKMDVTYPTHLNLPQQGSFQLGYYHQTQYRYTKKEDK